jgi:hypothetical protein
MKKTKKGSWTQSGIIAAVICFCLDLWYVVWPDVTYFFSYGSLGNNHIPKTDREKVLRELRELRRLDPSLK